MILDTRELRNRIKYSQQRLSNETGISKEKIGQWEIGNGNPKVEDYMILINFFIKKGVITNLDVENAMQMDIVPSLQKSNDADKKDDNEPSGRIPFYDTDAAAGTSYEMNMEGIKDPTGTIDIGDMLRDSQAAMRVYGNSMIPSYPPGCVIGLRRNYDGFIEPGTVYVIETKSNRYIKRLFYNKDKTSFLCISDSEIKFTHGPMEGEYFYPPFEIPLESVIALYDVTGVIKRNKNSAIVHQNES